MIDIIRKALGEFIEDQAKAKLVGEEVDISLAPDFWARMTALSTEVDDTLIGIEGKLRSIGFPSPPEVLLWKKIIQKYSTQPELPPPPFYRVLPPEDLARRLDIIKSNYGSALNPTTEQLDMLVVQLGLPHRSYILLERSHVLIVGQILELGDQGLQGLRNFGTKHRDAVYSKLEERGIFPTDPTSTETVSDTLDVN